MSKHDDKLNSPSHIHSRKTMVGVLTVITFYQSYYKKYHNRMMTSECQQNKGLVTTTNTMKLNQKLSSSANRNYFELVANLK